MADTGEKTYGPSEKFDGTEYENIVHPISELPDDSWVGYDDYVALENELSAKNARIAELEEQLEDINAYTCTRCQRPHCTALTNGICAVCLGEDRIAELEKALKVIGSVFGVTDQEFDDALAARRGETLPRGGDSTPASVPGRPFKPHTYPEVENENSD